MYTDTHIDHIIEAARANKLILFVGAGISKDSGYPLWGEVIKSFGDDLYGEENNYELDYLKIPQYYYNTFGKIRYEEKILESFNEHNARPNPIHKQIDRIAPKHIITTNYDTLLEDQLNSGILKYEVIKKDSDVPNSKLGNYIIKMHGDINERNFVLKEDDYYNYNNDFPVISQLIQSLIVNNTLLFIGYSLSDTTFNSIYRLISSQLGNNVNNAYLYTTDNLNEFEVRYYDNLNIKVIGSESTKTKLKYGLSEKGLRTYNFLRCVSNGIKSYDDIYKDIEPFNSLKFIEYSDLINYGVDNVGYKRLMNLPHFIFEYNDETPPKIDKNTKLKLKEFLISKTDSLFLFNEGLDSNRKYEKNGDFNTAYKFYDKGDYKSAEEELEILANKFLKSKDYINYLIALFNIDNINNNKKKNYNYLEEELENNKSNKTDSSDSSKDKNPKDYYLGDNFGQVLDNILRLSTNNDRKVILFLRDEVFNFRYLYRKQRRIYDRYQSIKLDWLKSHDSSKRYSHYDSNIVKIKKEFISLNQFIDCNGIFIRHYNEFRSIVNIYFETLIYSHTLSKLDNDNMHFSSVYSIFDKEDVIYVFKYIDRKYFREFLDKNKINNIRITEDAYDYLINEILSLIYLFKENSINMRQLYYLNNYIFSLSYIDLNDPNRLIEVLQSMQVFNTYTLEINNIIIKLVEDNIEKISDKNIENLHVILNNNLEKLYETNKDSFKMGYSNYGHYIYAVSSIVNYINSKTNNHIEIKIYSIEDNLYLIKAGRKDIKEILSIYYYLTTLKHNINEKTSKLVDDILQKYSDESEDIDIEFVSMMIIMGNHNFDRHFEYVYNKSIEIINKVYPEGIIVENSYKYSAIDRLYIFYSKNLIDRSRIIEDIDKESARGINARFDWFILEDYNFDNIERLIDLFGVESFKNNYLKSQKEIKAYECYKDHLVEEKFKL